MTKNILVTVISWLLIALFVYAAVSKLFEFNSFVSTIQNVPFIGTLASMLGWLVPVVELVVALLLVRRTSRLPGLYAAFFLMLGFTTYIFVLLHFGHVMLCSCGGVISKLSVKNHLWFNAAFLLLSGIGVYLMPSYSKKS